jgi:hypothetical protein
MRHRDVQAHCSPPHSAGIAFFWEEFASTRIELTAATKLFTESRFVDHLKPANWNGHADSSRQ